MINYHAFDLAHEYASEGMTAYVKLQELEFNAERNGYSATRHQREVGTAYFDQVLLTVTGGLGSTGAIGGSTEAEQFAESTVPEQKTVTLRTALTEADMATSTRTSTDQMTAIQARYPRHVTLSSGRTVELRLMGDRDRDNVLAFARSLPPDSLLYLQANITEPGGGG